MNRPVSLGAAVAVVLGKIAERQKERV